MELIECLVFVQVQLGNPETSDAEDWRGLLDYAWSHAVVSDETHKAIIESCDFYNNNTWSNEDCSRAVEEVLKQYKEIDIYSLYTSTCIGNSTGSETESMQVMFKSTSKMVSVHSYKQLFVPHKIITMNICSTFILDLLNLIVIL